MRNLPANGEFETHERVGFLSEREQSYDWVARAGGFDQAEARQKVLTSSSEESLAALEPG
jgi:hypothetical protein